MLWSAKPQKGVQSSQEAQSQAGERGNGESTRLYRPSGNNPAGAAEVYAIATLLPATNVASPVYVGVGLVVVVVPAVGPRGPIRVAWSV